ncbi:DUF5615 family PIN-like protein [bacterium]|nr:DUF5615 family PIN-like protein [bacterium]
MKFKLDENLGITIAKIFLDAGYDTETVRQEGLSGASDKKLIQECKEEKRCLVTLDLDFSNPLIFTPTHYYGIAVLRVPVNPSFVDFQIYSRTFLQYLAEHDIRGKLWIVQQNQIRVYSPEELPPIHF